MVTPDTSNYNPRNNISGKTNSGSIWVGVCVMLGLVMLAIFGLNSLGQIF